MVKIKNLYRLLMTDIIAKASKLLQLIYKVRIKPLFHTALETLKDANKTQQPVVMDFPVTNSEVTGTNSKAFPIAKFFNIYKSLY